MTSSPDIRLAMSEGGWTATLSEPVLAADGQTRNDALTALGQAVDEWLDEVTRSGDTTAAATWWASKVDQDGSVVDFVVRLGVVQRLTATEAQDRRDRIARLIGDEVEFRARAAAHLLSLRERALLDEMDDLDFLLRL